MAAHTGSPSTKPPETYPGASYRQSRGSDRTCSDLLRTVELSGKQHARLVDPARVLDTNHGYAKEPVENSELAKRQEVLEGREHRLEHLAQVNRVRLAALRDQDHQREEQVHTYEQRWMELSIQVIPFEATGR